MTGAYDVESGQRSTCLAPMPLLRRKKLLFTVLLMPIIILSLIYNGILPRPFAMQQHLQGPLAQINALVGQLPGQNVIQATDGQPIRNALLDKLHRQGTDALSHLQSQLGGNKKVTSWPSHMAAEMNKFNLKSEGTLLLLQSLKVPEYDVGSDWKEVFITRSSRDGGFLGSIGGGPRNKFSTLLLQVGFGPAKSSPTMRGSALEVYRQNRADWVGKVREMNGLTVFSKSTCPHSLKTKELLNSMGANYTLYEVDQRSDTQMLQLLLTELTGHKTFPTILMRDVLVGGNHDIYVLNKIDALKSMLCSVGAL